LKNDIFWRPNNTYQSNRCPRYIDHTFELVLVIIYIMFIHTHFTVLSLLCSICKTTIIVTIYIATS